MGLSFELVIGVRSEKNRRAASKMVRRWSWLVPTWCERLVIEESDETTSGSPGERAAAASMPEYKHAIIRLNTSFWSLDETDQSHAILHEIIHIAHGRVLNTMIRRLLDPIKEKNEELYAYAESDMMERIEEFTETLANRVGGEMGYS
jgi:hypothetical protein